MDNNRIVDISKLSRIVTQLSHLIYQKKQSKSIALKQFVITHIINIVYMLVMNKKISTFINQNGNSFKKDTYYRLLQNYTTPDPC